MAYFDQIVPIPEGKIVRCKSYVYLTLESVYFPEKKYNTHKRVCIGKAVNDLEMRPNEKYFIHFPDEVQKDEEDEPEMSDSVVVGSIALTDHLYESLGLRNVLRHVFPESYTLIEDIASYFCLSGSSVMQHYPAWRFNHLGHWDTNVSDSTISRMLNTDIKQRNIENFFELWNKGRDHDQKIYFNFDSTNMGCESTGVEIAEYGYAKDDPTLPQINLAMATSNYDGLPLIYDLYAGSIIDVSELHDFLTMAKRIGYSNVGLILDRGYLSKANLNEIRQSNFDFLIMLKNNNKAVREAILEYGPQLMNGLQYGINRHDELLYGMTIKKKLFSSDEAEILIHLYYDHYRNVNTKFELTKLLKKYEDELKRSIECADMDEDRAKKYARYFDLEMKNGVVIGYKWNQENIDQALLMSSCFAIASTEEMTVEQAIDAYRSRDEIEKLFESIKRGMDGKKFRVHSDEALTSKVFIFFIAAILRSQIYFGLKELKQKENDRKNFTVPAIIKELEKIIALRQKNGKYERCRVLTKQQKKILSAFNISEKDIDLLIKNM